MGGYGIVVVSSVARLGALATGAVTGILNRKKGEDKNGSDDDTEAEEDVEPQGAAELEEEANSEDEPEDKGLE